MGTSAGKLADSESSETDDEEEDPVSCEGNVQDHAKVLRKSRQAVWSRLYDYLAVTISWKRGKSRGTQQELGAARADVSHLRLKEELENHQLYSIWATKTA